MNQPINLMNSIPALQNMNVDITNRAIDPSQGMMLKAMGEFANKLISNAEKNKYAQIVLELNKLDQQYREQYEVNKEIEWQDPDKRDKAMNAFNATIMAKKELISKSGLGSDNLIKLELYLNESTADKAFQIQTDMNKIWIKQETDRELLVFQEINTALGNLDYNDETSRRELNQMLVNSKQNLITLGMDETRANDLYTTALNNTDVLSLGRYIEKNIMSGNYNPQEKKVLIDELIKRITSTEALDNDVEEILKSYTGKDKEYVKETLKDKLKSSRMGATDRPMQQARLNLERYYEQIRTEESQMKRAQENLDREYRNILNNLETDIASNIRSGNNTIALTNATGEIVTQEDLLKNKPLMIKNYFGKELKTIVDNNSFISTFTNNEISDIKEQVKLETSNASYSDAIKNKVLPLVLGSNGDYDGFAQRNVLNELVNSGVITPFDANFLLGSGYSDESINILNLRKIGENNGKTFNVAYVYNATGESRNLLKSFSSYTDGQIETAFQIIQGKILKGEIDFPGQSMVSDEKFPVGLMQAYNKGGKIKKQIDEVFEIVKGINTNVPSETYINKDKVVEAGKNRIKIKEKSTMIRLESQERPYDETSKNVLLKPNK